MIEGVHLPRTLAPEKWRCGLQDVVMFRVIDIINAQWSNSDVGDYPQPLIGAMRPLLRWTTKTHNAEHTAPVTR